MYKIQTLNKISAKGLENFPRDSYEVASSILNPDAILLRSQDMHNMDIPSTVKAVARAGAGVNNIPIENMTEHGIVVFNTPGANANAVKELVILALLLSSRPVIAASEWVKTLADKGDEIADISEKNKGRFIGPELRGKTLGVIGLGAVGVMVADAAVALGMNVIGYDPYMSVDSAWSLDRHVRHAETLAALLTKADYITIHIPLMNETKGFLNAEKLRSMKDGVKIVNFARGGLVVDDDMLMAIKNGKVDVFITDFANAKLLNNQKVICLPHLGASTPEAEDNCACMAVEELRNYLERGCVRNSVNFPKCNIEESIPHGGTRLCIANKNVPGIVAKFTTVLGNARININRMINQHRDNLAYNIIDADSLIPETTLCELDKIPDVIKVRPIAG